MVLELKAAAPVPIQPATCYTLAIAIQRCDPLGTVDRCIPCRRHCRAEMQVRQLRMPDTRSIYGSSVVLQRMYGYERKRLQATLRELLFRSTPSARR